MKLSGQIAIVTGAGRGIGRAIAEQYAAEGARVALVSRTREELDKVAQGIAKTGGDARTFVADVSDLGQVQSAVAQIEDEMGPVDVLMNNAGVHYGFGPIWEIDPDQWWQDMTVNVRGVFNFCREVSQRMIDRQEGRIINMVGGGFSGPSPNMSGYGASKTAVMRLTETFAEELKEHNVKVFAMGPGLVKTPLTMANLKRPVVKKYMTLQEAFDAGRDVPSTIAADIATELASGRFDALTGRMIGPNNDFDKLEVDVDQIVKQDLLTLRLKT